jgi:hypothetical protein
MQIGYIEPSTIISTYANEKPLNAVQKMGVLAAAIKGYDTVSISYQSIYLFISQQVAIILQSDDSAKTKAKNLRDYILIIIRFLKQNSSSMPMVIQLLQDIIKDIRDKIDIQNELLKLSQSEYDEPDSLLKEQIIKIFREEASKEKLDNEILENFLKFL